jgi:cell fate regulator YaaT (PSP1 superfamily)
LSESNEHPAEAPSEVVVGVRFQSVGKVYHFDATRFPDLREGDFVIVTTSRGQQLGEVAVVGLLNDEEFQGPLKPIDRRATGRDLAIRQRWEKKEREALETARELNAEVGLSIKLVKADYSFDGRKLTFLYSAEERKETRPLRQRLSRAFRAKVDLRQIGPRDVAKIIGGYGACGGPRCCSRFLTEFSPISIRMAKAQGISLNPSEITGMCGRLRCCLMYEYEQYREARKHLPRRGKRVGTPYGEGKVVSLLPLREAALVDLGERRVEVPCDDIMPVDEWRALQANQAQQTQASATEASTKAASDSSQPSSAKSGKRSRRSRRRKKSSQASSKSSDQEKPAKSASKRRRGRRRKRS